MQQKTFNDVALKAFKAGRSTTPHYARRPAPYPEARRRRRKAFFFANYSYVNDSIPGRNQGNNTVPANEKHLQGDFSDMLRLPSPNQYIIYDPLTARPDPTNPNRVIRTPFPNNIIPRDRIFNPDGTYKNICSGFTRPAVPKANQNCRAGTTADPAITSAAPSPDPVSICSGCVSTTTSRRPIASSSGAAAADITKTGDWTSSRPHHPTSAIARRDRDIATRGRTPAMDVAPSVRRCRHAAVGQQVLHIDKQNELTKYKPDAIRSASYLDEFCTSKDAARCRA